MTKTTQKTTIASTIAHYAGSKGSLAVRSENWSASMVQAFVADSMTTAELKEQRAAMFLAITEGTDNQRKLVVKTIYSYFTTLLNSDYEPRQSKTGGAQVTAHDIRTSCGTFTRTLRNQLDKHTEQSGNGYKLIQSITKDNVITVKLEKVTQQEREEQKVNSTAGKQAAKRKTAKQKKIEQQSRNDTKGNTSSSVVTGKGALPDDKTAAHSLSALLELVAKQRGDALQQVLETAKTAVKAERAEIKAAKVKAAADKRKAAAADKRKAAAAAKVKAAADKRKAAADAKTLAAREAHANKVATSKGARV